MEKLAQAVRAGAALLELLRKSGDLDEGYEVLCDNAAARMYEALGAYNREEQAMGFMTNEEELDVLKRSIDGTESIKFILTHLTNKLDEIADALHDNDEAMEAVREVELGLLDIEKQCSKIVGEEE